MSQPTTIPSEGTPWIASGLPHAQVGVRNASPRPLPDVFTIELSGQTAAGIVLSDTR